MTDGPQYRLYFDQQAPFENPMRVSEDGDSIAELDLTTGTMVDGTAPNLDIDEDVCTKVFDGHHWAEWYGASEVGFHEGRHCTLCGKRQRRIDRWEDVE